MQEKGIRPGQTRGFNPRLDELRLRAVGGLFPAESRCPGPIIGEIDIAGATYLRS